MRIALAQLNPVVGDVAGNAVKVGDAIGRAADQGAELVVLPELSLVGYPPRDLLDDAALVADNVAALERIARTCRRTAALVGAVWPAEAGPGAALADVAALLADGAIRQVHAKALLPNYDVYDDPRYFRPGAGPACSELNGRRFAVAICEDMWDSTALGRDRYGVDPIARLAGEGVDLIVNIAASGFERGKTRLREQLLARQARRARAAILYVNQVGGNDDMIFDGGSCVVSAAGEVLARAAGFREDLLLVDTDAAGGRCETLGDEMTRLAEALKLGLADYVRKGGFAGALVGLDGDVGSAVVATLAADALGSGKVRAVAACSGADEKASAEVRRLADGLGIELEPVPPEAMRRAVEALSAAGSVAPTPSPEVHARLCGDVLSLRAEAAGRLALAAADKTDLALGRPGAADTITAALAPIGDVLRRDVLRLAEHLNAGRERIPRRMLQAARPPAGGGPAVDEIIEQYVEGGRTVEQMARDGIDGGLAEQTVRRVDRAERRRTRAPLVLKVTARAFGLGRRMPVARRYG